MSPRRVKPIPSWDTRLLAVVTAMLVVFGVAAVYGASSIVAVQNGSSGTYFASRQAIKILLGKMLLVFSTRADYHI